MVYCRWILKVRSKPWKHVTVTQVSAAFRFSLLLNMCTHTYTDMHAHTHTHSTYHHGLGVSVQQSNFITVNFMYYLTGLKSTAPPFHYSEGNNFIKLEHWLKLVKECVYIVWLKTSRLDMSLCKCSGPLRPSCSRWSYYYNWENSWKVLLLVVLHGSRGRTCEWDLCRPLGKLIYPFRSCCQHCQKMSYCWFPREWADWMKSFSDQWRDHFYILMLIIPDGIVKGSKKSMLKAWIKRG